LVRTWVYPGRFESTREGRCTLLPRFHKIREKMGPSFSRSVGKTGPPVATAMTSGNENVRAGKRASATGSRLLVGRWAKNESPTMWDFNSGVSPTGRHGLARAIGFGREASVYLRSPHQRSSPRQMVPSIMPKISSLSAPFSSAVRPSSVRESIPGRNCLENDVLRTGSSVTAFLFVLIACSLSRVKPLTLRVHPLNGSSIRCVRTSGLL